MVKETLKACGTMKANKTNLLYFLSNAGTIEVPVYQSSYTWGLSECEKLMSDILSLAQSPELKSHFLGVLLHIDKTNKQEKKFILLDGAQKLISVSLLLAAIRETITEEEDDDDLSYEKLHKFLFVKIGENYKPKILANPYDKTTYDTLLTGGEISENALSANMIENYNYFKKQVEESKWSFKKLFNSILKLEAINIQLDENVDNPQAIFDSLNEAGKSLSTLDKIKNEIMMGLNREAQVYIYASYWAILEACFAENASMDVLEKFLASYLSIQNQGRFVGQENLYEEFKDFYSKMLKIQTREEILTGILNYANYFLKLYSLNISSRKVKRHIKKINQTAGDKAYPFLMELMDDLENGLLTEDLLAEVLKTTLNLVKESEQEEFDFSNLSVDINRMLALKDFIPKIDIDKIQEPLLKPKTSGTINDIIKAKS